MLVRGSLIVAFSFCFFYCRIDYLNIRSRHRGSVVLPVFQDISHTFINPINRPVYNSAMKVGEVQELIERDDLDYIE